LFTAVKDFLLNAEMMIFNLQLVAGYLPISLSMPLSALVSTHVLAMAGAEISIAIAVKANVFFIFHSFC
jgi:hypothetical protein